MESLLICNTLNISECEYTPDYSPINAITGRRYRGNNALRLLHANRKCEDYPCFLTYKQARKLNGYVKKGQKHKTKICFYNTKSKTEQKDTIFRWYPLFHMSQCEFPQDKADIILDKIGIIKEEDADTIIPTLIKFKEATLFNLCLLEIIKCDMLYDIGVEVLLSLPPSVREMIWPQIWEARS